MSDPADNLPLADGVKLLLNWFAQRTARCEQLGHPHDATRYRSYSRIVERLAEHLP